MSDMHSPAATTLDPRHRLGRVLARPLTRPQNAKSKNPANETREAARNLAQAQGKSWADLPKAERKKLRQHLFPISLSALKPEHEHR
jgi:hypothetical protein